MSVPLRIVCDQVHKLTSWAWNTLHLQRLSLYCTAYHSADESHFLSVGESQLQRLLGDFLLQRLQQDRDGTLQQRLFRSLRNAILDGVLAPKTRLPASRDLAKEIKVSWNTVLSTYEQLQAQGYVDARTGQGTWVAEHFPEQFLSKSNENQIDNKQKNNLQNNHLSQRGSYLIGYSSASPYQWGAFVPGAPDVTEFPHHIFSRIQNKLSKEPDISRLIYSNAGAV